MKFYFYFCSITSGLFLFLCPFLVNATLVLQGDKTLEGSDSDELSGAVSTVEKRHVRYQIYPYYSRFKKLIPSKLISFGV